MTEAPTQAKRNSNTGHGHVYLRPDGNRMRCGGPGMCAECSKDLAKLQAKYARADTLPASPAPWQVRPIEWKSVTGSDCQSGKIGGLSYLLLPLKDGEFRVYGIPGESDGSAVFDNEEEAKEAAYLDAKAHILSSLVPTEQPPQADVQEAARVLLAHVNSSNMQAKPLVAMSDAMNLEGIPSLFMSGLVAALRALAGEEGK